MFTKVYHATANNAERLRTELTAMGVKKARVRIIKCGTARLVLNSAEDREAARDALVLAGALTPSGTPFTDPRTEHSWNTQVEIFVRFDAP